MPVTASIDDDRAGFYGCEGRQGRAAEIRIPGRVDQVDMRFAAVDRGDRGAHRVFAFLFQRVLIGHRRAALDRACRLDCAAGMQQGFEQRGFAGARMTRESDVADAVGGVRHVSASRREVGITRA